MTQRDPVKIITQVRTVLAMDSEPQAKVYAIVAAVLDQHDFAACLQARADHPEDRSVRDFMGAVADAERLMREIGFTAPEILFHRISELAGCVLRPVEIEAIMHAREARP